MTATRAEQGRAVLTAATAMVDALLHANNPGLVRTVVEAAFPRVSYLSDEESSGLIDELITSLRAGSSLDDPAPAARTIEMWFSFRFEQCALPGDQRIFHGNLRRDAQIEGLLVGFEPGASAFEKHAEFDVGVGGTDVFDDLLPAAHVSGDLHGRGPGLGAHLPDKRHPLSLKPALRG